MPNLWFFESDVFLFRKACLLYKTSKIVFFFFFFTIYDMGIEGVTKGYRGLQGVPRGNKGLQGVTGSEKGLQGFTKDYRIFFLELERSQILFLGLFCIKIKVEEISNF